MGLLLESIVASLDDARAAAAGGADRFELCSALALGGLTPSLGLLAAIKAELPAPVMCMIRPREGGMAYTEGEFAVMQRDAALALEAGADGLVFGFLTPEGEVDVPRCRRFLGSLSRRPQLTFHRAFDVVVDSVRALEQLIDLGIDRVLTSGRAPTALEGVEEIRRTVDRAAGRIRVLPGGEIRAGNVAEIVARTGVEEVHLYVTRTARDSSAAANPAIYFGATIPSSELEYEAVDKAGVREIRAVLDTFGRSTLPL
jgi:copper homeostasis protein